MNVFIGAEGMFRQGSEGYTSSIDGFSSHALYAREERV